MCVGCKLECLLSFISLHNIAWYGWEWNGMVWYGMHVCVFVCFLCIFYLIVVSQIKMKNLQNYFSNLVEEKLKFYTFAVFFVALYRFCYHLLSRLCHSQWIRFRSYCFKPLDMYICINARIWQLRMLKQHLLRPGSCNKNFKMHF